MSSWRELDDIVDDSDDVCEQPQRSPGSRKKRKSNPPASADAPEYLTLGDISRLQARGVIKGNTFRTLATLMGESNVKARMDGGIISVVNTAYCETFIRIDTDSMNATVYDQSCVCGRSPMNYLSILVDDGHSATVQKNDGRIIAIGTPTQDILVDKGDAPGKKKTETVPPAVDLYLHLLHPSLPAGEDKPEAKKCIDYFRKKGYTVKVWACGREPLAELAPDQNEVPIRYTSGTYDALAKQCLAVFRDMGLSPKDARC
jgi:hypothetical protein